jgi:putative Mg2+ transporter-C (MgtC) family protein
MFDAIIADLTTATALPYPVIVLRLVGAVILVAGIGYEREVTGNAAGLRTHMLVSVAAALFAILSIEVIAHPQLSDDQVRADPLRVIEAVTAGVAFLSAGFIIVARGRVRGVTTGAGIWFSAAIGLAAGFGYWSIGLIAAVIGFAIIAILRRIEAIAELKPEERAAPRADQG